MFRAVVGWIWKSGGAHWSATNIVATREKSRTELLLADDDRLIPAVIAAIHHVAAHTGMQAQAESALLRKAEDLCIHAWPQISSDIPKGFPQTKSSGNGHSECLQISVLEYDDRVEVVLEHPGKLAPPAPKHRTKTLACTAMGFAPQDETPVESSNGVDRIISQPVGGKIRTTLVQYSHGSNRHS